jgi:hypothetical protein
MRPRPQPPVRVRAPETPEKLFTQVISAARPRLLSLWEQADRFFPASGTRCEQEIQHHSMIGKSYYQCNPHFWQCYWQGGVIDHPALEIDLFGQTFHVVAKAHFDSRYYDLYHRNEPGLKLHYGYVVEVAVKEIPNLTQTLLLTDSCRDTYLPQRIYGYGQVKDNTADGFIWDNFGRDLFIDKFYVSNRQVNEWRKLAGAVAKIETDPKKWPLPAILNLKEQIAYCSFYGKRLLEAKLFDAATMSPPDLKNSLPEKIFRPDTPWQRDLSKSFLGMARINPDYQLTPLDCQLAEVQGCREKYFSTDSASWMGFHYALGFYPESLANFIEPDHNLKMSSKFLPAASTWHELGNLAKWNGKQLPSLPVAFRCYEEVVP